MAIAVPTDVLAPSGARTSAGTVLIAELNMIFLVFVL